MKNFSTRYCRVPIAEFMGSMSHEIWGNTSNSMCVRLHIDSGTLASVKVEAVINGPSLRARGNPRLSKINRVIRDDKTVRPRSSKMPAPPEGRTWQPAREYKVTLSHSELRLSRQHHYTIDGVPVAKLDPRYGSKLPRSAAICGKLDPTVSSPATSAAITFETIDKSP